MAMLFAFHFYLVLSCLQTLTVLDTVSTGVMCTRSAMTNMLACNTADFTAADAVVDATHRYKEIFYGQD